MVFWNHQIGFGSQNMNCLALDPVVFQYYSSFQIMQSF